MATLLANEINTTERDIAGPTAHVQIVFPLMDKNNRVYLLCTEITKRHLNNGICQHCDASENTHGDPLFLSRF